MAVVRAAREDAIASRQADRGGQGQRRARLKVSRHLRLGDVVTGTGAGTGRLFVVRVMGETERRGPAPVARSLYEDLTPETPPSASGVARIEVHRGLRPTKRDRRRLEAIKAVDA